MRNNNNHLPQGLHSSQPVSPKFTDFTSCRERARGAHLHASTVRRDTKDRSALSHPGQRKHSCTLRADVKPETKCPSLFTQQIVCHKVLSKPPPACMRVRLQHGLPIQRKLNTSLLKRLAGKHSSSTLQKTHECTLVGHSDFLWNVLAWQMRLT